MTVIAAAAFGAAVVRRHRSAMAATGLILAFVVSTVAGVACAAGLVALWATRRGRRRADRGDDEALLAELAALGLSSGLTFRAAAVAAADFVPGESGSRLRTAIRLESEDSSPAHEVPDLVVVARRALVTGAPLLPAVSGHADALRDVERTRQLTAARRLPVKLLFPLALLILPGFLVLTIGPAMLGSLERLGI